MKEDGSIKDLPIMKNPIIVNTTNTINAATE